jgi:hypothetical protein
MAHTLSLLNTMTKISNKKITMNTDNQKLIDQIIVASSSIARTDTIDEISKSKDSDMIMAMLNAFNRLEAGEKSDALVMAATSLFETVETSLDPLLHCLNEQQHTQIASSAAYLLGEIAYKQGANRDRRILPALIQGAEKTLSLGVAAASNYIYSIRECARSGAVPEAESILIAFLVVADQPQPDFRNWYLSLALEVLAINATNNPEDFEQELSIQLKKLSPLSYSFKELSERIEVR